MPTREPAAGPPAITGIERECLRQAVHDLRNRLNATSILLHIAMAAAAKDDPGAAAQKVSQAVRELQTLARLLDQLVATSDSVAPELGPIDLGAAVADASRASAASATGVGVHVDALARPSHVVLSCPIRLPRVLGLILDRCIAALPEGGDVRFTADAHPERIHLVAAASGPRVVAPAHGATFELTDGALPNGGWFALKALVRGLRGDVRVTSESGNPMRVEVELPRHAPGTSIPDRNPVTPSTH